MGGGGKGGAMPEKAQTVYTDPVTGRTFIDDPNPAGGMPFIPNDPNALSGVPGWKSGATKLNDYITQREADAKAKKEADTVTADTKSADELKTWQGKRDKLIGDERNAITSYFTQQGLDPNQYTSDIDAAINQRTGTLQDKADLTGLFGSDLPQNLINTLTTNRQNKNLATYNKVFDPNYATAQIGDTWDDPVIDQILGKQFDPLKQSIDLAHKRGQLDDRGVTGALQELDTERTAARGQLSGIGNDLLSGYRSKLGDYISGGRTAAGAVPLGSDFSVDPYTKHAAEMISGFQGNLANDFTSKVGSASYGDINKILNAGGIYQGPIGGTPAAGATPVAGGIVDDILDPTRKRVNQTQGQF